MELWEIVLTILAVYYVVVAVAFQLINRLAEWRMGNGLVVQHRDEVSLLVVTLLIPFAPTWVDWRVLLSEIRYGA